MPEKTNAGLGSGILKEKYQKCINFAQVDHFTFTGALVVASSSESLLESSLLLDSAAFFASVAAGVTFFTGAEAVSVHTFIYAEWACTFITS